MARSVAEYHQNVFQQIYEDAADKMQAACSSLNQPLLHPPLQHAPLSLTEEAKLNKAEEAAATVCNRLSCMYENCNKKLGSASVENRKSKCDGLLQMWTACYAAELTRVGLDPQKFMGRARDTQFQHVESVVLQSRWRLNSGIKLITAE